MRTKSAGTMAGLLTFALLGTAVSAPSRHKPAQDAVPDARTAIRMAVVVRKPIHDTTRMASEKPFKAAPAYGLSTLSGSLQPGVIGGVAEAAIAAGEGASFASTMDSEPRKTACAHA